MGCSVSSDNISVTELMIEFPFPSSRQRFRSMTKQLSRHEVHFNKAGSHAADFNFRRLQVLVLEPDCVKMSDTASFTFTILIQSVTRTSACSITLARALLFLVVYVL